jgi:type IV pilus assembly protein PilX
MSTHALPRMRRTRGASLIVALIFLVILAMLGVTVAGVASLEERGASNTRDRDLALQAAEAALHDAEAQLADPTFRAAVTTNFDPLRANSAAFWEQCFDEDTPVAPCDAGTHEPKTKMTTSGDGAIYDQPRYVIEKKNPIGTTEIYLVTARAVGGTQDAIVVLQAEYGFTPTP